MEKFAVIGHPIGHTMSPFIHKALFNLNGIDAEYTALDIEPQNLQSELKSTLSGLKGFNVTIPHKEQIIPLLDGIYESAKKYGAVNCVKRENGKLYGCSTDAFGFIKAIESNGVYLKGNILVLGAGGAASTIASEAAGCDCNVTIAVRESGLDKASQLKARLDTLGKPTTVTTLDNISGAFDLCVNATPVGMYPNAGTSPVSEAVLKNCSAVFDAVYNPYETEFIKLANNLGLKTVGGMAMLVWQAVKAHEFWYGASFETDKINKIIEDANLEMEQIFYGK